MWPDAGRVYVGVVRLMILGTADEAKAKIAVDVVARRQEVEVIRRAGDREPTIESQA